MKPLFTICFLVVLNTTVFSQPTISFQTITNAVPGDTMDICMYIDSLFNVASFQMNLSYNPSVLTFMNGAACSPLFNAGFYILNPSSGGVLIAWFSLEPMNFVNHDSLCFRFIFNGGSTPITITGWSGITIIPGSVSSLSAGQAEPTATIQQLKISPNPSLSESSGLTMQAPEGMYQLGIFNGIGSCVMEERITIGSDGILRHPGFSLKPGVYWIRLRNNQNSLSSKLIIH